MNKENSSAGGNVALSKQSSTSTQNIQNETPVEETRKSYRDEILQELAERCARSKPVECQVKPTQTPKSSRKQKKKAFQFGGPSLGEWMDTRKKRAEKYSTPVKTHKPPSTPRRSASAKKSATRHVRTATRRRKGTPRRSMSQPRVELKKTPQPPKQQQPTKEETRSVTRTKKPEEACKFDHKPLSKSVTTRKSARLANRRSSSQPRMKPNKKVVTAKPKTVSKPKKRKTIRTRRTRPSLQSRTQPKPQRRRTPAKSMPRQVQSEKKNKRHPRIVQPLATLRSLKKGKTDPGKTKRKRNLRAVENVDVSNPRPHKKIRTRARTSRSVSRSASVPRDSRSRSCSRNCDKRAKKAETPKRKVVRGVRNQWAHVKAKVDTGLRKPKYKLAEVEDSGMTRSRKRKLSALVEEDVKTACDKDNGDDGIPSKRRRIVPSE